MTEFNIKTHWPLTHLEREQKNYWGYVGSIENSQIELSARQLVLDDIGYERATKWGYGDENTFDRLVKMGLAKLFINIYEATPLLMERQAEVLAKRVSLEVMAKNMGLTIPVKFAKPAIIKHNYKAKGSIETLKDFIKNDENENAYHYALETGNGLRFSSGHGNTANPFYDCSLENINGYQFFSGRDRGGYFNCIHLETGLSAVGGFTVKTRQEAISAAKSNIDRINEFNKSAFDQHCAKYEKISQYELQAIYLNEFADLRKAA